MQERLCANESPTKWLRRRQNIARSAGLGARERYGLLDMAFPGLTPRAVHLLPASRAKDGLTAAEIGVFST